MGRSSGCQIVFEDALVSRRHAELVVTGESVTLRDLGSINGAFVNGERVDGSRDLVAGDRVSIGKQEMELRVSELGPEQPPPSRFTAETLTGFDTLKATVDPGDGETDSTRRGDVFELLGGVADKVLALGRGDEAEKLLRSNLEKVLEHAEQHGDLPAAKAETAATYAVKLASATGRGRWVDYALHLYSAIGRPLPAAVVDQLYTVLRAVDGVDLALLRRYAASLSAEQARFGPAERFLVQRIGGLVRLAELK